MDNAVQVDLSQLQVKTGMLITQGTEKIVENYLDWPLYSFRSKAYNMFVGYLGTLSLENRLSEYPTGKSEYQAFMVTFRLEGEHRIGGVSSDLELQLHLHRTDDKRACDSVAQLYHLAQK